MIVLLGAGILALLLGSLGFLVAAFREHILWGLACLFIGPAWLVFLVLHWQKAKQPFFLQLAGLVMIGIWVASEGGHLSPL